jgi:hypothetical protein
MVKNKGTWRFKKDGSAEAGHSAHAASLRWVGSSCALMLLLAGLTAGLSSQARAEPQANHVLSNCTFTTNTVEGTNLQDALNIPDLGSLNGGQLEASYIIIYVRQNPNNGQHIGTTGSSYTGPILCYNVTDSIQTSPEGTAISGPIDILGAEESSHIQIQPSGSTDTNQRQKRVCHTVASNTDCFLIGPGD